MSNEEIFVQTGQEVINDSVKLLSTVLRSLNHITASQRIHIALSNELAFYNHFVDEPIFGYTQKQTPYFLKQEGMLFDLQEAEDGEVIFGSAELHELIHEAWYKNREALTSSSLYDPELPGHFTAKLSPMIKEWLQGRDPDMEPDRSDWRWENQTEGEFRFGKLKLGVRKNTPKGVRRRVFIALMDLALRGTFVISAQSITNQLKGRVPTDRVHIELRAINGRLQKVGLTLISTGEGYVFRYIKSETIPGQ